MTGNEAKKIYFHEYIPFKKQKSNNKLVEFIRENNPSLNDDEIDLMLKINDKKDIKEFAIGLGMTDQEIKKVL